MAQNVAWNAALTRAAPGPGLLPLSLSLPFAGTRKTPARPAGDAAIQRENASRSSTSLNDQNDTHCAAPWTPLSVRPAVCMGLDLSPSNAGANATCTAAETEYSPKAHGASPSVYGLSFEDHAQPANAGP